MQTIFDPYTRFVQLAFDNGADCAALVEMSKLAFHDQLRDYCRQNSCGRYGTSWAGPPAIGDVKVLEQEAKRYPVALVIQTIGQLQDSFDYEGMVAARDVHRDVFSRVRKAVHLALGGCKSLDLSCGCCEICETCTYPDEPCRYPDQAVAAVEAYGIDVTPMLTACGLKYNNGQDTVSYVSLFCLPESAD